MRQVTANKENYLQYVLDAAFFGTLCAAVIMLAMIHVYW